MTLLNNGLRSNIDNQNAQDWRRKPTIYGPGGGNAPVYATGAVSLDYGATWAYGQPPPAEVIAAAAPSGDLPFLRGNFVNGLYWMQGLLSGQPFEQSTDWADWASNGLAEITVGVGITHANAGPVLTAGAFALVPPAGFTETVENSIGAVGQDDAATSLVTLPSYDSEWSFYLGKEEVGGISEVYALNNIDPIQDIDIDDSTSTLVGANKGAHTITPSRIAASVNGNAIFASDVAPSVSPAFNTIGLFNEGSSAPIIKSWTLYRPQPEGDLPAMST